MLGAKLCDSKLYVKTCLFLINLTSMSLCKKKGSYLRHKINIMEVTLFLKKPLEKIELQNAIKYTE